MLGYAAFQLCDYLQKLIIALPFFISFFLCQIFKFLLIQIQQILFIYFLVIGYASVQVCPIINLVHSLHIYYLETMFFFTRNSLILALGILCFDIFGWYRHEIKVKNLILFPVDEGSFCEEIADRSLVVECLVEAIYKHLQIDLFDIFVVVAKIEMMPFQFGVLLIKLLSERDGDQLFILVFKIFIHWQLERYIVLWILSHQMQIFEEDFRLEVPVAVHHVKEILDKTWSSLPQKVT